ncbi:MAG: hypothetical protein AB1511_10895 [Deinococcota bacterium]
MFTTETGEGRPLTQVGAPHSNEEHALALTALRGLREEFAVDPNIGSAAELVSAAVMLREHEIAEDAAEFLLMHAENTTPTALTGARKVLGVDRIHLESAQPAAKLNLQTLQSQVRELRARVRVFPYNALVHLDLARLFTALGSNEKAERHLHIAIGLAPRHRLTVRAVVRFLIHLGQPERALRLLRSLDGVRHDPWLMATEISTASVAGRPQQLVRQARTMLDRHQHSALDTSELAASLATLEVVDGNAKKARQMMHRALEGPTENTVAQARWVGRRVKLDLVGVEQLDVPRNFEARAWAAYASMNFEESQGLFAEWLRDEPFSSRPALLASYLADMLNPSSEQAIEMALIGVQADGHDVMLRNNLAFYLGSAGRLKDAKIHLAVATARVESGEEAAVKATQGLIAFREGDPVQGERLYRDAIQVALMQKNEIVAATAQLYLAREATVAGLEHAEVLVREAFKAAESSRDPDLVLVVNRVQRDLQRLR